MMLSMGAILILFLSTLSLRRATVSARLVNGAGLYFYPRSPCGERRGSGVGNWPRVIFLSTLSLRRATVALTMARVLSLFLSTLSLRRATSLPSSGWGFMFISIHALLAESDRRLWLRISLFDNFYPRSPCGERHVRITHNPGPCYFYPRSPCGERRAPGFGCLKQRDFYPRSPCGERQSSYQLHP